MATTTKDALARVDHTPDTPLSDEFICSGIPGRDESVEVSQRHSSTRSYERLPHVHGTPP